MTVKALTNPLVCRSPPSGALSLARARKSAVSDRAFPGAHQAVLLSYLPYPYFSYLLVLPITVDILSSRLCSV
jgi:hypothetical protein